MDKCPNFTSTYYLVSRDLLRTCKGSLTALIQDKYENIHVQSCGKKMCTACEIANRFDSTITVNLRGLCRYTYLDTEYQIQYDPQNIISYVGIERNIIEYDFKKNEWHIKDR